MLTPNITWRADLPRQSILASMRSRKPLPLLRDYIVNIKREVCERHGVAMHRLAMRERPRAVAYARQELAYRLRTYTDLSWQQIAAHCGVEHHSSVIYGAQMHAERMGQ